jgi:hypothetical protein
MTSEQIAKALEIAITLTKADYKWLHTDERGYILIKDPLFSTLKTVIRLMNTNDLKGDSDCRVFLDDSPATT